MRSISIVTALAIILVAGHATLAQGSPSSSPSSASQIMPASASEIAQIGLPSAGTEETLRVYVGRSMVVRTPEALKRVSVTDPAIAEAVIVAPDQIMIHGLKAGTITLLLWDDQERLRSFDLRVLLDIRSIAANLKDVFPNETIDVSQSGSALVLTGEVSAQAVAEKAVALAQTGAPSVVNMMRVRAPARNTVSLQVRFAEVDRSAVQQLGLNILSTGAANTPGIVSTQQFGAASGASIGAVPQNVQQSTRPQGNGIISGAIGQALGGSPAILGLSDLLNIFLFRPDLNLGVAIRALQQQNLLQILAEPNLLATSGQEASFLAGGEFPFPVVQGGTNYNSVTIQWKEFGVKLKFTANVLEDGNIRMKVAPEVSALDFTNGLTISGFLIPALSTRRADTEVDLRDGQSFAIAGLIDNRLTEIASKIPWLGDVPVIGKLFRSRSTNRSKTELLVLVTPKLVKPLEAGQVPPTPPFPMPFLDNKKFDGKTGETQAPPGAVPPPVKKDN